MHYARVNPTRHSSSASAAPAEPQGAGAAAHPLPARSRGLAPASSQAGSNVRPFANATEVVADILRLAIYEGRLEPGERLREAELAAEIGVSRTPIREALLILQTEGLVESIPNRGSVVRDYSMPELLDFMEVRGMLQAYAAGQAARLITPEQLAELRRCCAELADLIDSPEAQPVVDWGLRFHDIVVEAAGSRVLAEVIRSASNMPVIYRIYRWDTPDTRKNSLAHLRRILSALERRDAIQAENATRALVLDVRDVVLGQAQLIASQQS